MEVSPGDYNISRAGPAGGLVTVTSALGLSAAESSLVECLASVSALAQPLSSHIHLTVGEGHTHTHTHTHTQDMCKSSKQTLHCAP